MAFSNTLRVLKNSYVVLLSRRCYALQPHSRKANFKKKLSATRAKYRNEIDAQNILVKNEVSQATEDAQRDKEREETALANNERELKRMAEIRAQKTRELDMKREERRIRGKEVRDREAAELLERRTQEVKQIIEMSKDFITMDNMTEKIEEALEKEVNYNFALNIQGKKVF